MSEIIDDLEEKRPVKAARLADGREPTLLGAQLRHELESNYSYTLVDQCNTWVNPAGVKATVGYSSAEFRMRFYAPGQVGGAPVEVVSMTRLDQIGRAREALRRWNERAR